MPVLRNAVRTDAFIAFNEQIIQLSLAASATDATERIGDDSCRFYQTLFQKRNYRQQNAGGITSRGGNERGLFYFAPIKLWKTVHGPGEQIGRRVFVTIELEV